MPDPPIYPRTIVFDHVRIRIAQRANGLFAIAWREEGTWRRTTITGEEDALKWSAEKARTLALNKSSRWVSEAEAELVTTLRKIAGPDDADVRRVLDELRTAREILGSQTSLADAARWFAEKGPGRAAGVTVSDMINRFLDEYSDRPWRTEKTLRGELRRYQKAHPLVLLAELDEQKLRAWIDRPTLSGKPSARTVLNRTGVWQNLLNRCKAWGFLSELERTAAERLRRPRLPDAGKAILSVDQARRLLAAVRQHKPKLETHLLIAGWLGARPSECQRLEVRHFDLEQNYLHVTVDVAGKTSQERFVPIDPRLTARLGKLFADRKPVSRACMFRAREFLSVLARDQGIVDHWPADVLRHSYCSYRLADTQHIHQVAEEAGNSPQIIRRNYRRPVRPEEGAAWWDLLDP